MLGLVCFIRGKLQIRRSYEMVEIHGLPYLVSVIVVCVIFEILKNYNDVLE